MENGPESGRKELKPKFKMDFTSEVNSTDRNIQVQ
jgi:hypothetical protein